MPQRYLIVSIDTEVDKDPHWLISDPVSFRSVTEGIPRILSPLFDRYGVKPTYFLSPEVLEERQCVQVLAALGERAELGTHLHAEFIEPERRLTRENMVGARADAIQKQYSCASETAKLTNLTQLFTNAFDYSPTSFRAGRYGMSEHTHHILADLGYTVDSSVTPGLIWRYKEGQVDFRNHTIEPEWISTPGGTILELPLSIWPASRLARRVQDLPVRLGDIVRRILRDKGSYHWLRPSWTSGRKLISYVQESNQKVLNMMFHSMEIIPNASPYARSQDEVQRILDSMEEFFQYWISEHHGFCSISEAVAHI